MWLLLSLAVAAEPNAAAGAKIYAAECVACHGAKGDGKGAAAIAFKPGPPDFTTATWWGTRTDAEVVAAIRAVKPGSPMAGFPALTDAQVADVAAHLRSFRH